MSDGVVSESWEFRLSQTPAALWPLLADTNRIHEALEMPRYRLEVETEGETRKLMARSDGGATRGLEWEETPFEWVAGQWWRFDRRFQKGPLARFSATLYLRKSTGGGTVAQYALAAEPNGVIGKTLLSSGYLRRAGEAFVERAETIDAFVSGAATAPFPGDPGSVSRDERKTIAARAEKMAANPFANGASAGLASMIAQAPVSELMEMRVRRIARMLDLSERAAAEACLAAAAAELLTLKFVVVCPRCRRKAETVERLADLPETAQCDRDASRFAVDLAVNVEAVFTPHPQARDLGEGVFCASGPMTAPHVAIQQRLEPGERRAFPYTPRPGGYRVRLEAGDGRLDGPTNAGRGDLAIDYPGGGFPVIAATPQGVEAGGEPVEDAIVFENRTSHPRLIRLERREWRADALTAAELSALQAYREAFPGDAPRAPLRAGRLAFVAYSLKQPERVYAHLGEAVAATQMSAFVEAAAGLARSRNGGMIRAQGERGLAAFLDPADAASFALALRDQAGEALVLGPAGQQGGARAAFGFGLSSGRALALARAQRFDYAGLPPALAERLAEAAAGGELALAEDMARHRAVSAALGACARRDDLVEIDGAEDPMPIIRAA